MRLNTARFIYGDLVSGYTDDIRYKAADVLAEVVVRVAVGVIAAMTVLVIGFTSAGA